MVNGRCVSPTRANRTRPPCVRLVNVPGAFSVDGVRGTNAFTFDGRIGGQSLADGNYVMTARPSANGQIGQSRSVSFTITG